MKLFSGVLVFSLVVSGAGYVGSRAVEARVAQKAPVTTTLKGVIKSIDQQAIVLVPAGKSSAEVTFDLTPSVKRNGTIAAGDSVEVVYYYEAGKRVVTELDGKAGKTSK